MIPIIIGAAVGLAFLSSGCVTNGDNKRGNVTEADVKEHSPPRTSPPQAPDRGRISADEFNRSLKFDPYGRGGAFIKKTGTTYNMRASMSKDPTMSIELAGLVVGERDHFVFSIGGTYSSPKDGKKPIPVIEIYGPGDPRGKPSVRQEISFGAQQSAVSISLAGQNGRIPQEISKINLVVLTEYGSCNITMTNPRLE